MLRKGDSGRGAGLQGEAKAGQFCASGRLLETMKATRVVEQGSPFSADVQEQAMSETLRGPVYSFILGDRLPGVDPGLCWVCQRRPRHPKRLVWISKDRTTVVEIWYADWDHIGEKFRVSPHMVGHACRKCALTSPLELLEILGEKNKSIRISPLSPEERAEVERDR